MLKPINDKIIIKVKPHKQATNSGIIIPQTVEREQQTTGFIVAIGSKVTSDVKVGDRLLVSKYSGTKTTFEGEDYLVVREPDILAVYND